MANDIPIHGPRAAGLLGHYGCIEIDGADAGPFLQSQLSADIDALDPEQSVLTGWHDRKGRVLACPRVVRKASSYWLMLPAGLVAETLAGLKVFVFRSKVSLADRSDTIAAAGVIDESGQRHEVYARREPLLERLAAHHAEGVREISTGQWDLLDIGAGTPQVYEQTRGDFTGQMINLDLIGGISFSKGCYPGQEVIARTHHLGRSKRRMQRYVCDGAAPEPGTSLDDEQGKRGGSVVRSAPAESGSEALIVTAVANPPVLVAADGSRLTPTSLPYSVA
ncbi:MAG: hypothetical protein KJO54_05360 [Gammaproteobacteria bacterium]|nr:hypothetical protein [Gammaproteobacteria bacterium]NNF59805.1 folate-binding protein YgfZ [Gammaproteobacteria bacterium]NNM21321.1 folate-binding protein YgfZ [Gammaproteobacteria bacterium]